VAVATPTAELQERSPGKFAALGPLTFATARRARESGLAAFDAVASRELEVDCSGITSSDSAGMTVLLDWLAIAKRSGRSMHFVSLPEQVQAIARISEVLELLEKGV
jgi:phospholipid transport system transporter-binding protein